MLKFKPGQVKKKLHVTLVGDSTPELSESFFMTLSHATGANICDAKRRGTITDDDESETESNDVAGTSDEYSFATALATGAIDPLSDVDYYYIAVASAGNLVADTVEHGAAKCHPHGGTCLSTMT